MQVWKTKWESLHFLLDTILCSAALADCWQGQVDDADGLDKFAADWVDSLFLASLMTSAEKITVNLVNSECCWVKWITLWQHHTTFHCRLFMFSTDDLCKYAWSGLSPGICGHPWVGLSVFSFWLCFRCSTIYKSSSALASIDILRSLSTSEVYICITASLFLVSGHLLQLLFVAVGWCGSERCWCCVVQRVGHSGVSVLCLVPWAGWPQSWPDRHTV